jgi:hypothetical protein
VESGRWRRVVRGEGEEGARWSKHGRKRWLEAVRWIGGASEIKPDATPHRPTKEKETSDEEEGQ